jgi:6-phosphogluconolactonase
MNSILFATLDEHAKYVAEEIALLLNAAIASRGEAVLAVSGGKSPIKLFAALRAQAVAWGRVTICLVDERWVSVDQERSNEKLARDHLMQGKAADAKMISVWNAGKTPAAAATALSAMFAASTPLSNGVDVAVMGMGDDGHTASWFPRSRELAHCLTSTDAFAAVSAEEGREDRVTMTLSTVAKARKIIMCVEGETKRAVLANALANITGAGSVEEYPVRAVLRLPEEQLSIRLA